MSSAVGLPPRQAPGRTLFQCRLQLRVALLHALQHLLLAIPLGNLLADAALLPLALLGRLDVDAVGLCHEVLDMVQIGGGQLWGRGERAMDGQ